MKRHEDLGDLKPAEKDILQMSEHDTACQYCGISYLILAKCEKMERLVKEMQVERDELRQYVEERPSILARLESAERDSEKQTEKLRDLELELIQSRIDRERLQDASSQHEFEKLQWSTRITKLQSKIDSFEKETHLSKLKRQNILKEIHYRLYDAKNSMYQTIGEAKKQIQVDLFAIVHSEIQKLVADVEKKYQVRLETEVKQRMSVSNSKQLEIQQKYSELLLSYEDLKKKYDRVLQELTQTRQDNVNHFNEQKAYSQQLQQSCIQLEDRIDKANMDIMKLTMERDRIEAERVKYHQLYTDLKEKEGSQAEEAERKVLQLKGDLVKQEKEYLQKMNELSLKNQKTWDDSTALKQAHKALAKKNEQMVQMERTIHVLNQNLSNAMMERTKTLEAHQSRVKQLQEKFLEDLKTAGKDQALEVELTLRRELAKDKEDALQRQRQALETEYNQVKKQMSREIETLKSKLHRQKDVDQEVLDRQWNQREREVQQFISDLKQNHQFEMAKLNQQIEALNVQLEEQKSKLNPETERVEERILKMQSLLKKKEGEIAFLKDTVRVECEERMGLVAELARLQNQMSQSAKLDSSLPSLTKRPNSVQSNPTPTIERESLSPKDQSIFKLFQKASLKNEKRLNKKT